MCRAPSVTTANQCKFNSSALFDTLVLKRFPYQFLIAADVDWALMNLMQDWFPHEAKEKQEANEKEVGMLFKVHKK
jgi:hypothetical protein